MCEFSGRVRDAFISKGHDAISCDLLSNNTGPHIQGDCLKYDWSKFDLLICHPPCTYLCSSGLHWNKYRPDRVKKTNEALIFVCKLLYLPCKRIALENPIGCISTMLRKPDQIIQPWMFGDDASKATCLWLKGLPPLEPTKIISPRIINGKKRWANQTDSGQNKLWPSETRSMERSLTYIGIANAMSNQWGIYE